MDENLPPVTVDVRTFHPSNSLDTCAAWNLLSSARLTAAARSRGCGFAVAGYVRFEALDKPRKRRSTVLRQVHSTPVSWISAPESNLPGGVPPRGPVDEGDVDCHAAISARLRAWSKHQDRAGHPRIPTSPCHHHSRRPAASTAHLQT